VTCPWLPAENDDVCGICGDSDVICLELDELWLSAKNDDVSEICSDFDVVGLELELVACSLISLKSDDVGEIRDDFDATWLKLVTYVELSGANDDVS